MFELNDFFGVHNAVEFLRRQCISEYWEGLQEDDVVAGLNHRQKNYLFTIKRLGPCSLHTIMHHTGLSSSAVSTAIDKLVRIGIVHRVRNDENRREVLVSIAPELDEHFREINSLFRSRIAAILAKCTPAESDTIFKGMKTLRGKFAEYDLL